jgi:RNA polymerase sigma-70 factor (ECF subfamily)
VVQEAFLKLWHRPQIWVEGKGAKFTTWFYRVVRNMCLDRNKKKQPHPLPEGFEIADDRPGADEQLDRRQKQMELERAIRELPERQQMALDLCFYQGFSNRQAAEIMEIGLKALQSLLMRAKTGLKAKLQDRSR